MQFIKPVFIECSIKSVIFFRGYEHEEECKNFPVGLHTVRTIFDDAIDVPEDIAFTLFYHNADFQECGDNKKSLIIFQDLSLRRMYWVFDTKEQMQAELKRILDEY